MKGKSLMTILDIKTYSIVWSRLCRQLSVGGGPRLLCALLKVVCVYPKLSRVSGF